MTDAGAQTRPLGDMLARLSAIENTMLDLDHDERINVLAYAIAGYVATTSPPGGENKAAATICRTIQRVCLPAMLDVVARFGADPALADLATTTAAPAGEAAP